MVNAPLLGSTEVNVLQAINLSLGTGAYLGFTDTLPKAIDLNLTFSPAITLLGILIVGWITKLLAENHKGYSSSNIASDHEYAVFQLAMTIGSFLALIVAARNFSSFGVALFWYGVAMALCLLWLGVGYLCGRRYRWSFVSSPMAGLIAAAWIAQAGTGPDTAINGTLLFLALCFLIFDTLESQTFMPNRHQETK